MRNKLKFLPLAAAVLFAPAYAEEKQNTYVGASIGQISGACNDVPSGITCDDNGLGFRGFGGIQLVNKHLAVEMGFTAAPKATEISSANLNAEISYGAFDVSFVGRYPFNDIFSVSARIGSAFWTQKYEFKTIVLGRPVSGSVSSDGTDLLYGVGVEITPAKSFSIRGEWIRVAADVDVDYLSLSAAYRF